MESEMPRLVLTMMKTLQDQSKLVQQIIDQQAEKDKAKDKRSARDKGRTAKKSAEKPAEKSDENSRTTEKDSGSTIFDPANTLTGRGRGRGGPGKGREDDSEEDTTRALSAKVGAGPLCAMNIGNTDATVTAAGKTDTTRTTN
uniref:Uncharacterized protein n=1 Tax=Amphimedon queenslandica TaxID=400682 RepID=A0A1X7TT32_AMPQE